MTDASDPADVLHSTTDAAPETAMPDRLSTDPNSPHYDEAALSRGVGIRFKGAQRRDVEEYSISQGWVRVALGKKVDRHGRPLTLKLSGPVEAWFERPAAGAAEQTED